MVPGPPRPQVCPWERGSPLAPALLWYQEGPGERRRLAMKCQRPADSLSLWSMLAFCCPGLVPLSCRQLWDLRLRRGSFWRLCICSGHSFFLFSLQPSLTSWVSFPARFWGSEDASEASRDFPASTGKLTAPAILFIILIMLRAFTCEQWEQMRPGMLGFSARGVLFSVSSLTSPGVATVSSRLSSLRT